MFVKFLIFKNNYENSFCLQRQCRQESNGGPLFEKMSDFEADSVGSQLAGKEGEKLKDIPLAEPVIRFMKKERVDLSEHRRREVSPDMLEGYDKIVIMAEPELVPDYLLEDERAEFWDIDDPRGADDETYKKVIAKIKQKIKELLQSEDFSSE